MKKIQGKSIEGENAVMERADINYMSSGHSACPGCCIPLIVRQTLAVLGKKTFCVLTASCCGTIMGMHPQSALKTAAYSTPFPSAAAAASGVRAALNVTGRSEGNVVVFAGDGGTADIGIQALSGAAERNDNIFFVCYDNEAYMNTGIQRSSCTPEGAWTTTTPPNSLEDRPKKDIMKIMVAHGVPYAATASIAFPDDMRRKFQRGLEINGLKFYHILSPCPVGWRASSDSTVALSRLGVKTGIFPLYEVIDGKEYHLTYKPKHLQPVNEYLAMQGRYKYVSQQSIQKIQDEVDASWQSLRDKAPANAGMMENETGEDES